MTDSFPKELTCKLCEESYSPVIQAPENKDGYKIYCSSCTEWLPVLNNNAVRVTLKEVIGLKGEALALAIQSLLAPCPCGGEFSHHGGERCPVCIRKIEREIRRTTSDSGEFCCPWDLAKLKKFEAKIFGHIFERIESEEVTLNDLIQKFEAGEIDAEVYMEAVESLPYREARFTAAVQTWSMILGPELAFRAAEEHGLVERFGSRILVSIAQGLEMATGQSVLPTLTREKDNWSGNVQKELGTFLAKIGGGF